MNHLCVEQLFWLSFKKVNSPFSILYCRGVKQVTVNVTGNNVLCGSKATEALDIYIKTLEKKRFMDTTKKAIRIKIAKALRAATLKTYS
jgi:hypothetical protein